MPDIPPYTFSRPGRSWTTLITLVVCWALFLLAWVLLQAAWWIIAILYAFTLPALWDFCKATTAGAELDDTRLRWHSGSKDAEVAFAQIDHIRLVTRLDLSVRAALVLKSGRKLRMPAESTPPDQEFEAALLARNLRVTRHHFTPL